MKTCPVSALLRFGDDMMKTVGIGRVTAGPAPAYGMAQGPAWMEGTRRVDIVTGWETVNRLAPDQWPSGGPRPTCRPSPSVDRSTKGDGLRGEISSFPYLGPPAVLPIG